MSHEAGLASDAVAASDQVERLLKASLTSPGPAAEALTEAAKRARTLCAAPSDDPLDLCLDRLLAQVLGGLCLEVEDLGEVGSVLDEVAALTGDSPVRIRQRLAPGALGAPALLELRPELALEAVVRMVAVLASAGEASLWEADAHGEATLAAHAGGPPSHRAQELARDVLAGEQAHDRPGHLRAFPIGGGAMRARAVLVVRTWSSAHAWFAPALDHAAAVLGAVLERRTLLDGCSATESSLSAACERRLIRVGLDLHDGPLQNVAGIWGDLKMLRHLVDRSADQMADGPRLLGSIGDLEARLEALDTELRHLSQSLESPAITRRPLAEVLRGEADSFRRRCDIRLALELRGDLKDLTPSQRIALVRIIQESLSNIREHSRAREVRVIVSGRRDRISAEVSDDGCGFDVKSTLVDAGRRGRLGLIGVSERARLLGGCCDIRSRPGGPTTIAVELPRWRPGPAPGHSAEPVARLAAT